MSEYPFVPLSSYCEYPEEEMMQRARDSHEDFRYRPKSLDPSLLFRRSD